MYANGIRNIDLHFIVRGLAAPVICVLLLSLSVPYTVSKGITPLLGGSLCTIMCLFEREYSGTVTTHNKLQFLGNDMKENRF